MADETKKEELLSQLAEGVLKFEEDDVVAAANEVLELGLDRLELLPFQRRTWRRGLAYRGPKQTDLI